MNNGIVFNLAFMSVVIIILCVLYFKGRKSDAEKIVYNLVCLAERTINGQGKGSEKMAFVLNEVYNYLPSIITIFYSEEDIKNIIEKQLLILKSSLENK